MYTLPCKLTVNQERVQIYSIETLAVWTLTSIGSTLGGDSGLGGDGGLG